MKMLTRNSMTALLLAATLPVCAANVVVLPGSIAGEIVNPEKAASNDCSVGFVANYMKSFVAGEVTKDIVVNYWMKGGGGGGAASAGGNGASVASSFTIPAGYTGALGIFVGRGGGEGALLPSATARGGDGGDGFAGGGGGGYGIHNCANCVYTTPGGGGGGSSGISLWGGAGPLPYAVAGGGGGGGGHDLAKPGGDGVGASGGGGGGGTPVAPVAATDVKGGIWNGLAPASAGGALGLSSSSTAECGATPNYSGGPGKGGTNGGGGAGGGGTIRYWQSGSCITAKGGGGGGGGGAGGGGGGGYGYSASPTTNNVGAAGGAYSVAGSWAPDLIASASYYYGGIGGAVGPGAPGGWGGRASTTAQSVQGDAPVYTFDDPYTFLDGKGVGGTRGYYDGVAFVAPTKGRSGGVFLKYAAPSCVIRPAL